MDQVGSFPRTPLLPVTNSSDGRRLWIKDEAACPTGTFKDRLGWALARQVEHSPVEGLLITCITLGNTLLSVTHFLNTVQSDVIQPQILGLFPLRFADRVIGPDSGGRTCQGSDVLALCESEGALTAEVDLESGFLNESEIERLARGIAPPFLHHRDISYGIGEKAYAPILEEALDDLGVTPSAVLVPVGAGVLFDECVDLVESRGLRTTVVGVSVTEPTSVGDKIYGYYSPYFNQLVRSGVAAHSSFSRHPIFVVTDDEIGQAIRWCSEHGVNAEPSAAAALVPYLNRNPRLPAGDVLWINTGNGLCQNGRQSPNPS
jgi:cysteine synthase